MKCQTEALNYTGKFEVYSESINHVDSNKGKSLFLVPLPGILSVFQHQVRLDAVSHVTCRRLIFCLEVAEWRQFK